MLYHNFLNPFGEDYISALSDANVGLGSNCTEQKFWPPLSLDPLSMEPLSLESLWLEPLSIDPLSLEPLSLESLGLEPLSVDPLSVDSLSVVNFHWNLSESGSSESGSNENGSSQRKRLWGRIPGVSHQRETETIRTYILQHLLGENEHRGFARSFMTLVVFFFFNKL